MSENTEIGVGIGAVLIVASLVMFPFTGEITPTLINTGKITIDDIDGRVPLKSYGVSFFSFHGVPLGSEGNKVIAQATLKDGSKLDLTAMDLYIIIQHGE